MWIPRQVERPTRRLHAAADCFRGLGYRVTPLPLERDERGRLWGASLAVEGEEELVVRERIEDARGEGFTDASACWWAAATGRSAGPWWSSTCVRRHGDE